MKHLLKKAASGFISNDTMCYHKDYYLENLEILTRRNKPSMPCIDGTYDEILVQNTAKSIGCIPSFIKLINGTQICQSKEANSMFENELYEKEHPPPCKRIKSMYQWHKATQTLKDGRIDTKPFKKICRIERNKKFSITIHFLDGIYKEIVYKKMYTIETLIGNSGGYIGKYAMVNVDGWT